jgi:hypothetical protein
MANFVVYALDRPDREKSRLERRPAHRARLRDQDRPVAVNVGGPLLDGNGTMTSSLFGGGVGDCRRFCRRGPVFLADAYASIAIHPFNWNLGNLTIGGAIDG